MTDDPPMVEPKIEPSIRLRADPELPTMPPLIEGDVGDIRAAEAAWRLAIAEAKHQKRIARGEVALMDRLDLGGGRCAVCGKSGLPVLGRGRDGVWRCEPCTIAAGFETSVFDLVRKVGAEEAPA